MAQVIEHTIQKYIPESELNEVRRIIYGRSDSNQIEISDKTQIICTENNFEVRAFKFDAIKEELRTARVVRIAAIQHSIVLPTTEPIIAQRQAIFNKIAKLIEAAAASNVNILCLAETWSMPFGLCTQDQHPWIGFAEDPETGPSTVFLQTLAKQYNMVLVSPILERDNASGTVSNTAVIISNYGKYLGKFRKYHIPSMPGRHNESTYYAPGNLGHPVFETEFGRIAVNICYGRHHPQHWMMFGLNGAEIVFNPSATVPSLSSSLWEIEARNAAIANNYFTVAINRVGLEYFHVIRGGDLVREAVGPYYGSSYVTAPDGSRTPALSMNQDGLLITEIDLNLCRQINDQWGFRATQRLAEYGEEVSNAADPFFLPQVIRKQ